MVKREEIAAFAKVIGVKFSGLKKADLAKSIIETLKPYADGTSRSRSVSPKATKPAVTRASAKKTTSVAKKTASVKKSSEKKRSNSKAEKRVLRSASPKKIKSQTALPHVERKTKIKTKKAEAKDEWHNAMNVNTSEPKIEWHNTSNVFDGVTDGWQLPNPSPPADQVQFFKSGVATNVDAIVSGSAIREDNLSIYNPTNTLAIVAKTIESLSWNHWVADPDKSRRVTHIFFHPSKQVFIFRIIFDTAKKGVTSAGYGLYYESTRTGTQIIPLVWRQENQANVTIIDGDKTSAFISWFGKDWKTSMLQVMY